MKLAHFFLPHPQTHKKAHLISFHGFAVYIVLFIILQVFLNFITIAKPGVLGIDASQVDQQELIKLTNLERQKKGLNILVENSKLDEAAQKKAQNMFEENYWAHYSPTGKDPWGFINGAGYKFSYAGENLARNFETSDEVVKAWMNSPTHRDNLLNSRYQEIGIAVVEGTLKGQKTVLVVQEFGRPVEPLAYVPVDVSPPQLTQAPELAVAGESKQNASSGIIDPLSIVKGLGLSLILLMLALIFVDILVMKRRAVERVYSRHIPHIGVLSIAAVTLYNMSPGAIL